MHLITCEVVILVGGVIILLFGPIGENVEDLALILGIVLVLLIVDILKVAQHRDVVQTQDEVLVLEVVDQVLLDQFAEVSHLLVEVVELVHHVLREVIEDQADFFSQWHS